MHPHRTGAARCGVSSCAESGHPLDAGASGSSRSARVIGLGAPVSVLIRPSACEAPLLRAQLDAEIVEHEWARPQASNAAYSEWDARRQAWHAMRAGLDTSGESTYELVWPTAYAHRVLFGAVREAVTRVAPPDSPADAASLTEALETAQACLATWLAFAAVDGGGLQDLSL